MYQLRLFPGLHGHLMEMDAAEVERGVADRLAGKIRKKHPGVVCTGVRRSDGRKVWRITDTP